MMHTWDQHIRAHRCTFHRLDRRFRRFRSCTSKRSPGHTAAVDRAGHRSLHSSRACTCTCQSRGDTWRLKNRSEGKSLPVRLAGDSRALTEVCFPCYIGRPGHTLDHNSRLCRLKPRRKWLFWAHKLSLKADRQAWHAAQRKVQGKNWGLFNSNFFQLRMILARLIWMCSN